MGTRFSFDIGTNSIGWAVWQTGDGQYGPDTSLELTASGVSIFKDGRNPKDQKSLAEMRRVPRGQRKRRDRFSLRRADLVKALRDTGLFPPSEGETKALVALDPYEIRNRGLSERLTLSELGRAIFHLNQRRGFRSNRKADRKDAEKGKIAQATKALAAQFAQSDVKTYGGFLWTLHKGPVRSRKGTRIRMEGEGAKALYVFYPTRAMIRHEFDELWQRQAVFEPERLTDAAKVQIASILFRQRDLKPPKVGKCTFVPEETRIPKALPSVEARELYERLNHLRLNDRPLSRRDRDLLATKLLAGDNLTFAQLRKALKLGGGVRINYEEIEEKGIKGADTAFRLNRPDHFGPKWRSLSWDEKDAFVRHLLDEPDEDRLVGQLQADYGLSEAAARNCANIGLPDGYSRLGPTANRAILENLIDEEDKDGHVIPYSEAVKRAGWHHSDERDGVIFDQLPYYARVLERHVMPGSNDPDEPDEAKRWGRITNPTVHIGLNQLRRIVNALVTQFGHPDQIIVELARELKLNAKEQDKQEKENRQNREKNDKRAILLGEQGLAVNRENLMRLRLFEEQQQANNGVAQCPYSGRSINVEALFSDAVEIDHILPISRTLDDGMGNKILCFREANRAKRQQTPFEAFSDTPQWPDILARGQSLRRKGWRFRADAMETFSGEKDFLQRQLNETKYLSRIAKIYLGKICHPDQVYVTPGRLVGLLRGKWGLHSILGDDNRKNRDDHRHHAIDAIVIGSLTRGLINYISHEAGRMEAEDLDRVFGTIPYPVADFRDQVRHSVEAITVRHKPEHGKQGALHEDTAYGLITDEAEARMIGNLVMRKPLKGLTDGEIDRIRNPDIRADLQRLKAPLMDGKGKVKDAKALAAILEAYGQEHGIRRIRIGKFDSSVVKINDRQTGKPYKAVAPGENHHVDIVQMRDGTWQGFAATVFEVNQRGYRPEWEQQKLGGKLVMRLHKGDMVELRDDRTGRRMVKVVQRIEISANRIRLAAHNEGGKLQDRHVDSDDSFQWDFANIPKLKERGCVAVFCDPSGQVRAKKSNVAL